MLNDNLPILIGVGQATQQVPADLDQALSHVDITAQALQTALADTGAADVAQRVAGQIDTAAAVRTFADSSPNWPCPFGGAKNFPRAVAAEAGITPETAVYEIVGGQSPQDLVGEFANKLAMGECKMVALFGGEAMANIGAMMKAGTKADWNNALEGQLEDRGLLSKRPMVSGGEIKMALYIPVLMYSLMEEARRSSLGASIADYKKQMGEVFAPFSEVAAKHAHAMFPKAYSAEELSEVSDKNRALNSCYTKNLVAKDGVNQAAAVIMTTVAQAKALGINEDRWVYLHGSAKATDKVMLARQDIGRSKAMEASIECALNGAGLSADAIGHFDIYSCFPIVVSEAARILDLKEDDQRSLTQTGGLPFFGGPGNNYSMHGLVSLVETLRADPGSYGLLYANGGWMSKHGAGVYSTAAPQNWQTVNQSEAQDQVDNEAPFPFVDEPNGEATIESFVVELGREGAKRTIIVARLDKTGERAYAISRPDDTAATSLGLNEDIINRKVDIQSDDKASWFRFTA